MTFDIAPSTSGKAHHLGPPPDPSTQTAHAPAPHPDPSARPATSAAAATAPNANPTPTAHDVAATPSATASAAVTPDGRSTTFQAVEGGTETRSGETLLVSAYSALWLILMAWLALMWRKQASVSTRIDDLERAIDRAAAKAEKAGKG
jgi:hypothetical protein